MGTSLDYLMFAVIVGGIGLCVAYVRDGYVAWRKHRAAAQRDEMRMQKLHAERLVSQEAGSTQNAHRERTSDPASSWTDGSTESDAYR